MSLGKNLYFLLLFTVLVVFGFVVVMFEIRIIIAAGKGWDVRSTRIVGLTLVIVGALSVLAISSKDTEIAPVVAVLGSIAGYLFGKTGD
jgi:uncharacterized membrane protein